MAKIMLRENDSGEILFYLAKRDMEEIIKELEFHYHQNLNRKG